jgi:hypothetical protein
MTRIDAVVTSAQVCHWSGYTEAQREAAIDTLLAQWSKLGAGRSPTRSVCRCIHNERLGPFLASIAVIARHITMMAPKDHTLRRQEHAYYHVCRKLLKKPVIGPSVNRALQRIGRP